MQRIISVFNRLSSLIGNIVIIATVYFATLSLSLRFVSFRLI